MMRVTVTCGKSKEITWECGKRRGGSSLAFERASIKESGHCQKEELTLGF